MRVPIYAAIAGSVIVASLLTPVDAFAAPKTVCARNCMFTSIQDAITAASPGATITIGAGKYYENVVVDKSVTLQGSGNGTVIYPFVSNPDCSDATSGSSLCGGAASSIILVRADDVTLTNLRLEGDNPNSTSGVVVGGADIDARNGIIVDFISGLFNNLTVSKVKVSDIYLRGIYASSGGTFNFNNNTIDNVQGSAYSIAMFNFGGSGTMTNNTVTKANDAISANWSTGTQFVGNNVSKSGSGVHTDNAGNGGGFADVISGNTVNDCMDGGYGVWVFVPYIAPTVEDNDVHKCSVGLALFGGFNADPVAFTDNDVNNSNSSGSVSAFVTSSMVYNGCSDANAVFTGNTLKNSSIGVQLLQGPAFEGETCNPPGTVSLGTISATFNANNIFGDTTGVQNQSGNVIDATNNWWGCSKGPNAMGCDTIVDVAGSTNFYPWLGKPAK